jgi:hypothetical protein
MEFLRKAQVFDRLQALFPFSPSGYFYDGRCSALPERRLSARSSLQRLSRVTERLVALSSGAEILAFNDQISGWRDVPRARRFSPVALGTECGVQEFIARHTDFRDSGGRTDNYYLTSRDFGWFAVFCHEGDWHLHGPRRVVSELSLA